MFWMLLGRSQVSDHNGDFEESIPTATPFVLNYKDPDLDHYLLDTTTNDYSHAAKNAGKRCR